MRAFEWHWLSRAVDSTPAAWRRHSSEVYSARFSHDGLRLATCGQDGARVWSWPAGEQLAHLNSHSYDVNDIGFSPDDALLATASDDGTVKLWDTADWSELKTLVHKGRVIAAHFSPDGTALASAELHIGPLSEDGKAIEVVRLWSVANWEETGVLTGPPGELHSLAWSPDGTQLATDGSELQVWDCATSTVRFTFGRRSGGNCVAFAHRRPLLAASAGGRTVIYSLETGRELAALPHGAESVVFDSDDRSVLTAGRDGIARLWKYPVTGEEGVETAAFRDTAPLWCAAFAPEGRTIVTTSHDGAIKLWNRERLVDRSHLHKLPGKDWELAIEYSPDGKALLVNRDSLRLIDLETGSTQRTLTNPGELVIAMVFSADGKWLATGDRQGRVSLWDTAHWRRRPVLETPDEMIDQITFLSDRETPLVIATPKRMFVAGLAPGQSTAFPMEILAKARFLALSPDRRTAATLREQFADRPVLEIWDLPSGSRRPVVDGPYYCIAFSPDGRQFVAGGRDGVTRLWQTDTWGEPMLLVGHTGAVQSVVISADGRTVATAAEDATVKLWNAATGRELLTFEARLRYAAVLRFSRDGTALAVSGAAGIHFSGPQLIVWRAGRDAGTK